MMSTHTSHESPSAIELKLTMHFSHPRAAVFALLSDPRQRPRWQRSLSEVEVLDSGEPRVGMRWRERPNGLLTFSLEITAHEPDQRWAERFTSLAASGSVDLRFSDAAAATTQVDVHATVELRPPLSLGSWAVKRLLQREVLRDLRRADEALSSSTPADR